jgi:hypothetical protein
MGDFYQGDPGFFSFLGKVAKTAVGFIPGVGGLAGRVLSKVPAPVRGIASRVGGQIVKHPVLSAAGAAGAIGAGAGVMGRMGSRPGVGMRGAGGARGFGRKHRRMRVTNPKALRRALRRAYGFERLAMKTIHLLHPKKHVKFGGFKKRRRAK